jgi:predicted  nucleic acid-binding Zn-ribbon protein
MFFFLFVKIFAERTEIERNLTLITQQYNDLVKQFEEANKSITTMSNELKDLRTQNKHLNSSLKVLKILFSCIIHAHNK